MKFFTTVLALAASVAPIVSAAQCHDPTVDAIDVNLERYDGKWYQIAVSSGVASITQNACECSVANYSLEGKNVKVKNTCVITTALPPVSITGTAVPATETDKAIFRVDFDFFPFPRFGRPEDKTPNYVVIQTWGGESGDYEQALVGGRCKQSLFVLSRTPTIDESRYQEIQAFAESKGYNYADLKVTRTNQSFDRCGNH